MRAYYVTYKNSYASNLANTFFDRNLALEKVYSKSRINNLNLGYENGL